MAESSANSVLGESAPDHSARQAAIDWLLGRIDYERVAVIPYHERQLKLDRMRQLLTRLGQPDAALKIVHIAGTKGKGSTAAMIAGILSAAGYRTGLFSSPHLERLEQRFAVDGRPCSADELVALVDRIRPVVKTMDDEAAVAGEPTGGLTFFDITTALALLHFVERQVDAAVVEVGLGGRLDSTNVCLPVVSVVTSISFDHTKQLGNTLASIAREKAGIIKPGVPVVCGVVEPEAQQVIATIAREHGCRLIQAGRDFEFRYRPQSHSAFRIPHSAIGFLDAKASISGEVHAFHDLPLALRGAHQAANAAVALAVIEELRHQGWCVSAEAIRHGLAHTVLAGRVEFVPGEPDAPDVVLDVAHNPASVRALVETLAEFPAAGRRTLVLSVSSDKDVGAIVRELVPHFDRFVVTQYRDNPRAVAADKLAGLVREALAERRVAGVDGHHGEAAVAEPPAVVVCPSPKETWEEACRHAQPGELICITGSFYLIAEMRPLVLQSATNSSAE
jgi:dihydrofolate synthase / folylpolyglutamate synthase